MHHLKGHENIVTLSGAFEDKANVHLVRRFLAQRKFRLGARGICP